MSALLLLLALLSPAARAEEGDELAKPINLWPLVYQERGPDRTRFEALFSLVSYERDGLSRSYAFHPFFTRSLDPDEGEASWSALWPLARYSRVEEVRRLTILPLFWQKLSPPKSHSVFFPFYSWHRDEEDRAFGILGFSPYSLFDFRKDYRTGDVSRRFLIVTWRRSGEATSLSVLPLYSQVRTPEAGSASLFPLFHRSWDRPRQRSHFSLIGWPDTFNLFELKRDGQEELREGHVLNAYWKTKGAERVRVFAPVWWRFDTEAQDTTILWPLYGLRRKGSWTEHSTVWPLFRTARDPETGERDLNLAWPLFRHLREPELRHDRLFPLASFSARPEAVRPPWTNTAALISPFPVFYRSVGKDYAYHRLLWLAWLTRRGDRRTDVVGTYYNLSRPSEDKLHRGLFPLWHRSDWGPHRLDLAPLWVSYSRPDLAFRTLFPLWWSYRSDRTSLQAAVPLYLRYRSEGHDLSLLFPFHYRSRDPERDAEFEYWFPLYGSYRRGAHHRRHLLFFPLWSRVSDEEAGLRSFDLLWPLIHHERSPDSFSLRLLPFYWESRRPDRGFAVGFPLYWHFRGPWGRHSHLFPLTGVYERPGFSLRYVLGPLWVRMGGEDFERLDVLGSLYSYRRRGGESRSHLFPFYWSRSSPEHGRRTFWPVFGTETASPDYRSAFFLGLHPKLSLVELARAPSEGHRLVRVLNVYHRRDPSSRMSTFFPLWWDWSDDGGDGTVLFPLFARNRDRAEGSTELSLLGLPEGLSLLGFSRGPDSESQRVLLYYHRRHEDRHMRVVFPLYWSWWEPGRSRTFLAPLLASRRTPTESRLGLLGFTPSISLFSTGEGPGRSDARLFPLFDARREGDRRELSLLGVWRHIAFFHGEEGPDGFQHRFFPLWSHEREGRDKVRTSVLWRGLYYRRDRDETDFRLLFRLLRVARGPDSSAFELNPFYFRLERKGRSYWALLGGLFGVETKADGSRDYRFLWVF